MKLKPDQIKSKLEKMQSERKLWENHWQEITDYFMPNKSDITSQSSPGEKKNVLLYDNTGMVALKQLAAAFHSMLTNPHTQWFEQFTRNPRINDDDASRKWMQQSTDIMHGVFNNSNFQTEVHEYYQDLCGPGTANLFLAEDPKDILRFQCIPIQEYYIDENHCGMIDVCYREFKWDAKQLIQRFGEKNMHKNVMNSYRRNDGEMFSIVHCIYPESINGGELYYLGKFHSQYLIKDIEHELEAKILPEFPYSIARCNKYAGEKWGRSFAMDALPDAKTSNKMMETMLKGAQQTINPAISVPDDGYIWPIRMRPGSINVRRAGTQEKIEPIFNDMRIDFAFPLVEMVQNKIKEAFFVDQLRLREGPQKTATEVEQLNEESMRMLGPFLGRQEQEFLRPTIDKSFNICLRRGLFPPIPKILSESRLDVQYSSLIARAQRANIGRNVLRGLEAMSPFIQLDPSTADNIEGNESVRKIARLYGWPQEMLRDKRSMDQIRQARAEAQAEQAEQEAQVKQADILSKTAQTAS